MKRNATCHPDRPYYAKGLCLSCYKNNPKYRRRDVVRKRELQLAKYGLTLKDFDDLVELQQGLCAICHEPQRGGKALAMDHSHTTGKLRGLLCDDCNIGLGGFRDSVTALEAAIRYLQETK